MIKFVQCVRRRADLPVGDFRRLWERYREAWRDLAEATHARRMTASIGLEIEQNEEIRLNRGTAEAFDGMLEVWWASGELLQQLATAPGFSEHLAAIRSMQHEFIDLPGSSFFFASEDVDLDESARPAPIA